MCGVETLAVMAALTCQVLFLAVEGYLLLLTGRQGISLLLRLIQELC